METVKIDWTKQHILKTNSQLKSVDVFDEDKETPEKLREAIEPWLSALFQSEHFSLLTGSGLTAALSGIAGVTVSGMSRVAFTEPNGGKIKKAAELSASKMDRGSANIEDDFRAALELLRGLEILEDAKLPAAKLQQDIDTSLSDFMKSILKTERDFHNQLLDTDKDKKAAANLAFHYLNSFLLSFASRAASRDRLNIFTTNYDRFIEYGCDDAGIILLDRFKGKIQPMFRNTRLELDYHYNPPGIRGEPRYVEGVARITKIHGSLDWRFKGDGRIIRCLLPFGAEDAHPEMTTTKPTEQVVIYPNSAKDIETAFYPYSELFRDFSSSICKPNSVVVTFGYGFGDSHINRVLQDMLTIPSTHIVIVAWDDKDGKIQRFFESNNWDQFTLLIGKHFGDIRNLVDNYLPKAAIDRFSGKLKSILETRNLKTASHPNNVEEKEKEKS